MSLDKDLEYSYDLVGKKIFEINSLSQKSIQSSINLFTHESLTKKSPNQLMLRFIL